MAEGYYNYGVSGAGSSGYAGAPYYGGAYGYGSADSSYYTGGASGDFGAVPAYGPTGAVQSDGTTGGGSMYGTAEPLTTSVFVSATNFLRSKNANLAAADNWSRTYAIGANAPEPKRWPKRRVPDAAINESQFCDLCKVKCSSAVTWRTHLESTKHKKKVEIAKNGEPSNLPVNKAAFKCDLCNVVLTSKKLLDLHIRGTKHMKAVRWHQTLGKPIPKQATVIHPKGGNVSPTDLESSDLILPEHDDKPMGEEYIEQSVGEGDEKVTFYCHLCECSFSEVTARNNHAKCFRHKRQYMKLIMDPDDDEANAETRKAGEEKLRKELLKLRQEELFAMRAEYGKDMELLMNTWCNSGDRSMPYWTYGDIPTDYKTDGYILAKHIEIYPSEHEIDGVKKVMNDIEKAIKGVSDGFVAEGSHGERLLRGAFRVGALAKGLMLQGDRNFEMVLLCSGRPTVPLLKAVSERLTRKLGVGETKDKYDVDLNLDDEFIVISSKGEPLITVTLSLTSTQVRDLSADGEDSSQNEPDDSLNKESCIQGLAEIRRTKWFQSRCSCSQQCMVVLRVMLDLCKRVPTWAPLSSWAVELLCEKVMCTAAGPLGPGEGFRRVFEALSSGILLMNGPGLMDPCEKDPVDVVEMNSQEREDITASAQHALRLISFGQLHNVLAVDEATWKKENRSEMIAKRKAAAADIEA